MGYDEGILRKWDEQAGVRHKPRRVLLDGEDAGKFFFPPDLVPACRHPLVRERGRAAVGELLVRRLYTYLDFTTLLEADAVNPVLSHIALRRLPAELPGPMYHDALKILTDESYHACQSDDLLNQVSRATSVAHRAGPPPPFFRCLAEIQADLPARFRPTVSLFAVVISETLISTMLSHIPRDERVVTAVRDVVADHAVDEARHRAFFTSLFEIVWPRLGEKARDVVGPLLPRLMTSFLSPDLAAVDASLAEIGLGRGEREEVIAESYAPAQVRAGVAQSARSTVGLFRQNGVFDRAAAADSFHAAGLVAHDLRVTT
jgi:hypothetical protein